MKTTFGLTGLCLMLLVGVVHADLREGLVAYYSFDDGTGRDSSPYGNHAEIAGVEGNVVPNPDGVIGGAMEFMGGASWMETPHSESLNFGGLPNGQNSLSMQIWLKTTNTGVRMALAGKSYQGSNVFPCYMEIWTANNGQIDVLVDGWDANRRGSNMYNGQWHHIVAVFDDEANQLHIYINGQYMPPAGTNSSDISDEANLLPLVLGALLNSTTGGYDRVFVGLMDEVAFWKRALSAEEVVALYGDGQGLSLGRFLYPIYPKDREANVPVDDVVLEWATAVEAEGITYDLYWIEADRIDDVNDLLTSTPQAVGIEDSFYAVPIPLPFSTTYIWKVDAYEPNEPNPILHVGDIWQFSTRPAIPLITTEPQPLWSFPGQTSEFTVVADSTTEITYTWYKVGELEDEIVAVIEGNPTLSIEDVQVDDEGYYYCILVNDGGQVESASAYLTVNRKIARWEFEESLEDITGNGWDGVAKRVVDRETLVVEAIEPNFVEDGISGMAVSFSSAEDNFIDILNSTQGFGFLGRGFTLSFWTKSTQSGWGTYLSKSTRTIAGEMDAYQGVCMSHNGGDSRLQLRGTTADLTASSALAINNGQWRHVAATYDAEAQIARLYVDGRVRVTRTGITAPVNPTTGERTSQPFILGSELTIDPMTGDALTDSIIPYDGLLDDVRVWNYPLTQTDIGYLYVEHGEPFCVGNPAFDWNGDCVVGLADFAILAGSWLDCNVFPDCVENLE